MLGSDDARGRGGACRSRPLASRGGCRLAACGCGVIHLSFGRATIRLTPEELADLGAAAQAALRAIGADGVPHRRLL